MFNILKLSHQKTSSDPEIKVMEKTLTDLLNKGFSKIAIYDKKCNNFSKKKWLIKLFSKITFIIHSENFEKILPTLNIPKEVKESVKQEISKGKVVVISEVPFQTDKWMGERYLVLEI